MSADDNLLERHPLDRRHSLQIARDGKCAVSWRMGDQVTVESEIVPKTVGRQRGKNAATQQKRRFSDGLDGGMVDGGIVKYISQTRTGSRYRT